MAPRVVLGLIAMPPFDDEGFDDDYAGRYALNGGNDKEIAAAADAAAVTGPHRYRVRAAEIDALEWTGGNVAAMEAFAGPAFSYYEGEASLLGNPGGAWHPLDVGNYAIKGVTGEFFIIFGEDFADNYEPIEVASSVNQVLACPMRDGDDSKTTTIGAWLIERFVEAWGYGSMTNDGDAVVGLIRAGLIEGTVDDDGYLGEYDQQASERLVSDAIKAMAAGLNAVEATR